MNHISRILIIGINLIFLSTIFLHAQCRVENTFIDKKETLEFDLFYKYGLLYNKAGYVMVEASLEENTPDKLLNIILKANTVGLIRSVFPVDDTISVSMTKDLIPLLYTKKAQEGKHYIEEQMQYTYGTDNEISVDTQRYKDNVLRFDEVISSETCIYDMLSVVYYARALNYAQMTKGDEQTIEFVSGRRKVSMGIEYKGKESIKVDTNTAECIVLALNLSNTGSKAFDKSNTKEAVKVYITDDARRIPVRIESKFKIGHIRGMLKSATSGDD